MLQLFVGPKLHEVLNLYFTESRLSSVWHIFYVLSWALHSGEKLFQTTQTQFSY